MSVTAARPCSVCTEQLDARSESNVHLKCKSESKARATSVQVLSRPRPWDSCRRPTAVAILAASAASASYSVESFAITPVAYGLPELLVGAGALLAAGPLVYGARLHRYLRARNAQSLWTRLARVTGDAPGARREHMTRVRYDARVPVAVTVHPGAAFCPAQEPQLRAAMADSLGVEPWRVRSALVRPGRWRLWLDRNAEAPLAQVVPMQAGPGAVQPEGAQPASAPAAPRRDNETATTRLQRALRSALDGDEATVVVRQWDDAGEPTVVVLSYTADAAPNAKEARVKLLGTMRALHPQAEGGDWFATWLPEQDMYVFMAKPDPLGPLVPLTPVEARIDLRKGVVVGVFEDGTEWRQPLLAHHILIAAKSRAGKSAGFLWRLIREVEPLVHAGLVRLWVFDPKGGAEFGKLEGVAHRYADGPEDKEAGIPGLVGTMAECAREVQAQGKRLKALGLRALVEPTLENPYNLVIVDEAAALTAYGDAAREIGASLNIILSQGAGVGFSVIAALQDPRAKVLDMRNLFTDYIVMRLDAGHIDMVLGRGMRAAGATADLIGKDHKGVGYVVTDDDPDPRRFRTSYVSDTEIDAIVARLSGRATVVQAPVEAAEQLVLQAAPGPAKPVQVEAGSLLDRQRFRHDGEVFLLDRDAEEAEDPVEDRVRLTVFRGGSIQIEVVELDRTEPVELLTPV